MPSNTFSRPGTGVSTSLIIIQKTPSGSNNIFIKSHLDNIGYILNRKNTPYKYKRVDRRLCITENGMPILDDDLVECRREIAYAHSENIDNIVSSSDEKTYETVNVSEITDNDS